MVAGCRLPPQRRCCSRGAEASCQFQQADGIAPQGEGLGETGVSRKWSLPEEKSSEAAGGRQPPQADRAAVGRCSAGVGGAHRGRRKVEGVVLLLPPTQPPRVRPQRLSVWGEGPGRVGLLSSAP